MEHWPWEPQSPSTRSTSPTSFQGKSEKKGNTPETTSLELSRVLGEIGHIWRVYSNPLGVCAV